MPQSAAVPQPAAPSKPMQTTHSLCRLYPGTPFLGPLSLGVGVPSLNMGTDLPGWVLIYLPIFNLNGQGTMATEAPLALGLAAGHLGEV